MGRNELDESVHKATKEFCREGACGPSSEVTHSSLEIVCDLERLSPKAVWSLLYHPHRDALDRAEEADFYGTPCLTAEVPERVARGGLPHFGLEWSDGRALGYGNLSNSNLSFVTIGGWVSDRDDAESWLEPFLGEGYRQARLLDGEYDFWQNAADPLEYEGSGKSYDGLPMKSNGLPPPLEQMVIDTSRNPGRRVVRQGFVEFVGCPMWLGEAFWSIAGCSREQVMDEEWARGEARPGGIVRLSPADGPFTSGAGPEGAVQDRLRALLYTSR
jgi:hypothetical protein